MARGTTETAFVVRNHDSDEDVPDEVHNRLLENIKQIHGQSKITPAVRNEPAAEVSEFSFHPKKKNKRGKPVFREHDLIRAIKKKQPKVAQKLETAKRAKTLSKPLETVHEKRGQREVGFQNLKTRLNRWNDVVQSNRVADQLKFPLNSWKIEVYDHTDCDLFSSSENPTSLELELNKVLKASETAKEDQEKIEQSKFRLTLKEIIEKRKMMAKVKAQASYKIAKATRQNKIKSKKYHRILRREKTKQQMKDFEELQKTDPEAALKQLENMEKARAEERATLRHRNTGKWARNQMVKAKYNKESRIALSEQLSKNRELTQKRHEVDSDSESVNSETEAEPMNIGTDTNADVTEEEKLPKETKRNLEEYPDPNKFLKVASRHLNTGIPEVMNAGDEGLDDEEEDGNLRYRMTISEAFAEDDVVAEFQEEKQKAEAESKPKVEDLSLPGWGAWTDSKTIQKAPQSRKSKRPRTNKRLLLRVPKAPPRKDSNKGHVIINEEKSSKMKEHLVTELPYPFTQVKDFEASIRAPIGRTWLPETAHQQLIAPPVVTKLGTVIEPMDEGELIDRNSF